MLSMKCVQTRVANIRPVKVDIPESKSSVLVLADKTAKIVSLVAKTPKIEWLRVLRCQV